jgi:uncharacterized phiE125 gp8 family phage protein
MQIRIKTDISSEPITIEDAMSYLHDPPSSALTLVATMVKAARELCEQYLNVAFAPKTIICTIEPDDMESRECELPVWPQSSISSVKSIDQYGTETALTLNEGYLVKGDIRKTITMFEQFSTTGFSTSSNNLKVEYTAGYGATDTPTLPSALRLAVLKQVSEWFINRDNYVPNLSNSVRDMLNQYLLEWL